MTQKHFFEQTIPVIKERKAAKFQLCDGVIIEFKRTGENEFSLLLNEHEVSRGNKYSTYAIKNSFLFINNNLRAFQWYPLSDLVTYLIDRNLTVPEKVAWENVKQIA